MLFSSFISIFAYRLCDVQTEITENIHYKIKL